MEHPFINDLSDKTAEELQDTIANLSQKLTFAYRTGNQALIDQLNMALESYRNQLNRKMDELFAKHEIHSKINVEKNDSNN